MLGGNAAKRPDVCGAKGSPGDADEVVPYEENTALLAEKYEAAGGKIELIRKEGVGHHPHCLEDPKPIVNFILRSIKGRG